MNKRILTILAIAAAAANMACDPYGSDKNGGTPAIIGVVMADADPDTTGPPTGVAPTATVADWTFAPGAVDGSANFILFVLLNKLMDGKTVETTPGEDCTPAGAWLTVNESVPAADCAGQPAGTKPKWFSCYDPASPDPQQGASIVIYRSCTPNSAGWSDAEPLNAAATYTFSGSIKDKQGNSLSIPVVVTTK